VWETCCRNLQAPQGGILDDLPFAVALAHRAHHGPIFGIPKSKNE
jgi:hypothetical protein